MVSCWHGQRWSGRDAFVGRLDAALALLDSTGIAIGDSLGDDGPVRVASDGAQYLVVWAEANTLRGARMDTDGTILSPGEFSIAVRSGNLPFDVAFDRHHYVLALVDNDGADKLVKVTRITGNGTFADPTPVEVSVAPIA